MGGFEPQKSAVDPAFVGNFRMIQQDEMIHHNFLYIESWETYKSMNLRIKFL